MHLDYIRLKSHFYLEHGEYDAIFLSVYIMLQVLLMFKCITTSLDLTRKLVFKFVHLIRHEQIQVFKIVCCIVYESENQVTDENLDD